MPNVTLVDLLAEDDPTTASWVGGRGCFSPLSAWLLRNEDVVGKLLRKRPPVRWKTIAAAATTAGITDKHGRPCSAADARRAWSRTHQKALGFAEFQEPTALANEASRVASSTHVPTERVVEDASVATSSRPTSSRHLLPPPSFAARR